MRNRRFDVISDLVAPVTGALVVVFLAVGFMRLVGCM